MPGEASGAGRVGVQGSGSCERRGSPGGLPAGQWPAQLAAAGGLCTGLGGARRKRSWECGAWRLCPAVTSLG